MSAQNTEHDVITHPLMWIAWCVGLGGLLFGIVLWLIYGERAWSVLAEAESFDAIPGSAQDAMIAAVVGAGALLIGVGMTTFVLIPKLLRTPFRHAPPDTLPEIPTLPVDTYTESTIKPAGSQGLLHRWSEQGRTLNLVPNQGVRRQPLIGVPIVLVVLLSLFAGVVFGTPLLDEVVEDLGFVEPTLGRWLIFIVPAILLIVIGGVILTMIMLIQKRADYSVAFDLSKDEWRIDREDHNEQGSIENLLAVQLCIHYQIIGTRQDPSSSYRYQIILVEKDRDRQRHVLLEAGGPANRIAGIGNRLADRLNLPLLHHATKSHREASISEGKRRWQACR